MRLTKVEIENYRGIKELSLPLDPKLTVLHGGNGCGKTSILTAIALALGGDESWSEFNRVELDRPVGYFVDPVVRLHCSPSSARSVPAEPFRITLSAPSLPIPGQPPWHRETMPPYGRPIFRFYNIDREIVSSLAGREMGSRPNYDQLFEWFYAKENEELRRRRDDNPSTTLGELAAVRAAICQMIDGVSNPRIRPSQPPRLVVSVADGDSAKDFALEQLSDGYRGVLALAADIAHCTGEVDILDRRQGQLHSHVMVLIDEIELHLHPKWQQCILTDLMRTFPNVQFIVSTHSPQVLTTVHPQHIVELAREGDGIVAGGTAAATYGARAGDVLTSVMGVEERPDKNNEFKAALDRYLQLVSDGNGESQDALALRGRLEEMSPLDPALNRADLEIKRRKLFRRMASER